MKHGLPAVPRMDNESEMTSRAIAKWAKDVVGVVFIPVGEPWKNRYVESFHSRKRDEFLNINT